MTSFLKADRSRPVAIWLTVVAIMVIAMVIVGGATRLTDSGLSITQWRPITGAIPPLSDAAWAKEFGLYQQTFQAHQLNFDMTVDSFKSIFWWEWAHRLLGRLVGAVFALPFVWFLIRREIPRRLIWRCFGLLLLGGLQGLVGWWMVVSGLSGRVSVAPERLATHLGLALVLYAALVWCALEAENGKGRVEANGPWARGGAALSLLIFVQIMLGALVAGNHAGKVFNDWPLMGGRIIPEEYAAGGSLWATIAHNAASVQFNHRVFAYLVFILIVAFAVQARRSRMVQPAVRAGAYLLAALAFVQVVLGITTILLVAPLWMGMIHQLFALVLLTAAIWVTWRARRS
jgi:cytochrome c oxidase assembly protein subunit 15